MKEIIYTPQPIYTTGVELPQKQKGRGEKIAKHVHDVWSLGRIKDGRTYGSDRNGALKKHPSLVHFEDLLETEKECECHDTQKDSPSDCKVRA